jgi:hypothetical protein
MPKTATITTTNTCDSDYSLDLVVDDVEPITDETPRSVFASLHTYADDKDESEFQKIHLPPICLDAGDLYAMFYQTKQKRFAPFVLNKLIAKLGRPALLETILSQYENQTGNLRSKLSAQKQITLSTVDLNLSQINSRIQKIIHMNYDNFIESFDNEANWVDETAAVPAEYEADVLTNVPSDAVDEVRDPITNEITQEAVDAVEAIYEQGELKTAAIPGYRTVRTSVEINVYSDVLEVGFILVVHFSAYIYDNFPWETPPIIAPLAFDSFVDEIVQTPKCGICVTYIRA